MFTSYLLALITTAEVARTSPADLRSMELSKVATSTVVVTAYNVGDETQNDNTPCIGATGEDLCEALEHGEAIVAYNNVPLNSHICIEGLGCYRVADRTSRKYAVS